MTTSNVHRWCVIAALILSALPALAQPSPTSPLAKIRSVWKTAVANDIAKSADALNQLDITQRARLPKSPTESAAAAVEAAWKLQPEAQAALDALIEKIRAYNDVAFKFRPEGEAAPAVAEAGALDLLFIGGVPLNGKRWESLRPLLLPVTPPEVGDSKDEWAARPRVKAWKDRESKGLELGDLGWDTPDADADDWKAAVARWSYDFAILHLWLSQASESLSKRLRADWLNAQVGIDETSAWAKQPLASTVSMLAGDYEWAVRARPAKSEATRFRALTELVSPESAANAEALLQQLRIKNAALHCLAQSVITRGAAPEMERWLDCAAHANPPWTRFEPELNGSTVRALLAAKTLPSSAGIRFQLPHQVASFHLDESWKPAVQGWSAWVPLPTAKSGEAAKAAPTLEAIKAPARPLDKAWPALCEIAAGVIAKAAPGSHVRALTPTTPGWWFAFNSDVWARALTAHGLVIDAGGAAAKLVFTDIAAEEKATAQVLLDGKPLGQGIEVSLPGPWPATFATPTRPWSVALPLALATAALLLLLVRSKRADENVWQFFLHSPPMIAVGLALLCTSTALTLWIWGPAIEPLRTPVSGVVEFELSAHEGVPTAQRAFQSETCTEIYTEVTGKDSTSAASWSSRWWRALKVGIGWEAEPQPTLAAADTTWRLRAVAHKSEWVRQGLLRAENTADFQAALAAMPYEGHTPALPSALLTGPTAGSTLVLTDGDDGDLRTTATQPNPPLEPVFTVLLATPPTDTRREVQTEIQTREAQLTPLSTTLVSPIEASPTAATEPEDMSARRAQLWAPITEATRQTWAKKYAKEFIQQSSSDKVKEGPARLTARLNGWLRWLAIALAAMAGGAVLSVALGRVLRWLRQFAKTQRSFALVCIGAALLVWALSFLIGTALLAVVEPWAMAYSGAMSAAARVLSVSMVIVLASTCLTRLALVEVRQVWIRDATIILRIAALGLGFTLAIVALACGVLLPVVAPGTQAWLPGGYSAALLMSATLACLALGLAGWGASAASKKNQISSHTRRRAATWS